MQQWKYSIKPTNQFLLHLLTMSILGLHLLATVGLAVYCALYQSELFSLSKLLLISLLLCCILSCNFLQDGILKFYGREMVSVANWSTVFMKQLKIFPLPKYTSNLLIELLFEVKKTIRADPNVDKFGIVAAYTFISLIPSVLIVPLAIVISDMDIVFIVFSVAFKVIGPYCLWLSSWYFEIIRFISYVYIYQCIAVVGPTFTTLFGACFQVLISTLTYLEPADLTHPNIQLLKAIFVTKSLLFHMLKRFNFIFLSVAFFILLITTNLSLYGKEFVPDELYICAPFLVFSLLWATALILHYENFIYELSCQIIERWKSQLALGTITKAKYTKLVLYSLQPIAVPVGNIGIVDRDIQINYFSTVLTYIVNTSIICKDLF